jgi:phosphatidylinositol alpha-1,6-mannosyltransferase
VRIAILKKGVSTIGGSESHARALARTLAQQGHRVGVIGLRTPWRRHGLGSDARFQDGAAEVQLVRARLGPVGAALDAFTSTELIEPRAVRSAVGGADVIHTFNREYMDLAHTIARESGAAHVTTPLVHPGQLLAGTSARDIARYRRADAVIALTRWEADWYVAHGVEPSRTHVTGVGPNLTGVDGTRADPATVLFVGRREPYKGYHALAHAAPLVWHARPDARFEVIGQRGWHAPLTDLALPAVRDPRWVDLGVASESEKAAAFFRCAVFCMPSVHETFGHTFLEAWLARRPVIAGDIPPVREIVEGAGVLVPQRPAAIAAAIIALLSDPTTARRLGEHGHERVMSHFTWEAVADRLVAAYESACQARGRTRY